MIKMVQAKSTVSSAIHELRREFYEQYKEDFQIIKEYEVMDASELAVKEIKDKAVFLKEQAEIEAKEATKTKANTKGK